jgi:hypothetical protein
MISPCCVMNTIACCCGIWIDQWMLGIGEVWYFSSKTYFCEGRGDKTKRCRGMEFLG